MEERTAPCLRELSEALTAASGYVSGIERLVEAEGRGEGRLREAVFCAAAQLQRSRTAFEKLREELRGRASPDRGAGAMTGNVRKDRGHETAVSHPPKNKDHGTVSDLPPGYHPSPDEEYMNPLQVAYFRHRLEQAQAALRRELTANPPGHADELDQEGDQSDQASAGEERAFEILNRQRVQELRRQTERALAKLDAGTYGYCDDTGEPIGLRRLLAAPSTCLSLAAQQAHEGRSGF